ncbi:hypothetical protein GCM10010238_12280 [Streptomyces griseoviridis]|uniref:Uncharacterized protein n=1 Tax=Streptomyces griseoviridis TaxID=45398 RepID=A0A918LA50_STRGD|nr:hypothetical protein GCM10010238_12280 [Streptomyces niveoruber]
MDDGGTGMTETDDSFTLTHPKRRPDRWPPCPGRRPARLPRGRRAAPAAAGRLAGLTGLTGDRTERAEDAVGPGPSHAVVRGPGPDGVPPPRSGTSSYWSGEEPPRGRPS